jgi:hypothetical protein
VIFAIFPSSEPNRPRKLSGVRPCEDREGYVAGAHPFGLDPASFAGSGFGRQYVTNEIGDWTTAPLIVAQRIAHLLDLLGSTLKRMDRAGFTGLKSGDIFRQRCRPANQHQQSETRELCNTVRQTRTRCFSRR